MTHRIGAETVPIIALALAVVVASPAPALAWGVPGCVNLPEYNRALGALQGMTGPCDMSVERARAVVAEHDGVLLAQPAPPPPPPRVRSRRRHAAHHPQRRKSSPR